MVTVNTRLLENVHTTAEWAAITDPLPDRVQGWEVDGGGLPVGTKIGNNVDLWSALPYWFAVGPVLPPTVLSFTTGDPTSQTISIPTGFDRNAQLMYRYKVGDNWQRDPVFGVIENFTGSTFTGWGVFLTNDNPDAPGTISSDGEVVIYAA